MLWFIELSNFIHILIFYNFHLFVLEIFAENVPIKTI